MPNPRQTKWDWTAHWPRMKELYHHGLTIPNIRRAVQSDSFRPSQRSVYNRFNLEGLSTEHGRKCSTHGMDSPDTPKTCGTIVSRQSLSLTTLGETVSENGRYVVTKDDTVKVIHKSLATGYRPKTSQKFGQSGSFPSKIALPASGSVVNGGLAAFDCSDLTVATQHDVPENIISGTSPDSLTSTSASAPESTYMVPHKEGKTGLSDKRKNRNELSASVNDAIMRKLADGGIIPDAQHSGGRTRHPYRLNGSSRPKTPLGRMYSTLFGRKDSGSEARSRQDSPFADDDSGYHSGRGTPSTLRTKDTWIPHPDSLIEFRGLYRVACHTLHEPKYPHQYREIQSCQFCGHASIHSLAWLSSHFSPQEFEAELILNNLYDVQALDASGNSALHYAAISGASYDHLKILIHAGVPLSRRNTADQNFLHCLRRRNIDVDIHPPDCIKRGLVDLLRLIESENLLAQQDNDGQTVLHVLASHITEPETRDQTFKIFSTLGFSTAVLNRFGESAKDLSPPDYKFGQTMFAADTLSTINTLPLGPEPPEVSEWQKNLYKQMDAYDIIVNTHKNPCYMDGVTQDTVLHALSRVNAHSKGAMQKNDIFRDLQHFIAKGANLNRHNRDGHHPLAAFICNREFRGSETGATMAKYIDTLLWKCGKHVECNDINVNMMTRSGSTALREAAIQAKSDPVRSLIEAGANVNARLNNDPNGLSVLQATLAARVNAVIADDLIRIHMFREVISHLEHAGAVAHPNSMQERGWRT